MKASIPALFGSVLALMMLLGLWFAAPPSPTASSVAQRLVEHNHTAARAPAKPTRQPFQVKRVQKRPEVKPLDVRDLTLKNQPTAVSPDRQLALEQLQKDVPGVQVTFDPLSDAPSRIIAVGRFLTPPAPGVPAKQIIASFVNRYQAIFGHTAETLEKQARVTMDDTTAKTGLKSITWEQELKGIRLFRTSFIANLGKDGQLLSLSSRFLSTVKPNRETPALPAQEAIVHAAASLGDNVTTTQIQPLGKPEGNELRQSFTAEGLTDTTALLTYLPMNRTDVRLGWDITLTSQAHRAMFRMVVDAASGEVLVRHNLTTTISDATYRVYADAVTKMPLHSPSPMHPSHQTPLTDQPTTVDRQSVTLSALDTTASPAGWVADGTNPETIGNNVAAHADVDANNSPDLPRPNGGVGRDFDFPVNLTLAPSTYRSAAIVNLFYVNNWLHDRLYQLGFTETARNFQTNNYGRGGAQNDAVLADAQDGSGVNNANFSTPADGSPGRMQMFIWDDPNPDRDSSFDNQIIIHEYVHGLSNRLVGGGALITKWVTKGMGEGWSDFYALAMLALPTDNPDHAQAKGGYATYKLYGNETNYYTGIRRYPYSPDKAINPLTLQDTVWDRARLHDGIFLNKSFFSFSNEDPSQVHNMGEIWCSALLEVRRLLIQKHGFAIGNELALQLVTDGMKLCPIDPTFIEARDAILQADLNSTSGDNLSEIWDGFARRGFGFSSQSPNNDHSDDVEEAFDVPGDMLVTPVLAFEARANQGASTVTGGSKTYVLKNNGITPLNWTAAATQTWTTVTPTNGTLAPGSRVTITWKINSTAKNLTFGEKHDTLIITNVGNGTTQRRPLIFNVTAKPVITAPLVTALRASNSSPAHSFTVQYTGSELMRFQWYKNGKAYPNTEQTLLLGLPSLAKAGSYKVKLTNQAGSATTAEAQLAVVDLASRVIPFTDGKNLTIKVPYSGRNLSFQWFRNGVQLNNGDLNRRVTGTTSPTLTIARFTAADVLAGNDFRCRVRLDDQELTTGAQTALVRDAPVITANPSPPTLMTSDIINWNISNFISQTNNQTQHLPTSYLIRGLPRGLTYNPATGFVTGTVRATGLSQVTLKIIATNGTGSSNEVTVTVPFLSLPGTAYGEFRGLIDRYGSADSSMGASLQVNITNLGVLTGKFRIGTRSYPFTSTTYDSNPSGGTFYGSAKVPAGTSLPLTVNLNVNSSTGAITGSVSGLMKHAGGTYAYYPSLNARRIPWKRTSAPATDYAARYTAVLQSTGLVEPNNPLGHSVISSTIDTSGNVTATIRLADGTRGTCFTKVADNGQVPLHLGAYNNTGSLHGNSLITSASGNWDNQIGSNLTWRKSGQLAGSTRSYVSGITLHNLTLIGGKWIRPVSPTLLLGVTDAGDNNARIDFTNAFINTSYLAPGGTFSVPFRIRSSPASSLLLPTPKPGGISLVPDLVTGLFTGRFTTVDDNPVIVGTQNIPRTAPFSGAFIQRLNQGLGHFNLARLPFATETNPARTPILSGRVLIVTPP